ncbi:MAG: hypothetical protein IJ679_02175, partial [Lachnospiraceae bacterium]|nr:hypothetical protein [Lachnospiraceae bacterium]
MKVYASIHVGSFGISLKVFEIVKGKRVRQIDEKRRRMDLSQDILLHDKLSREHLLEIIDTLRDMKETILSYKADDFDVYAGFALQSASNAQTLIDQAALATGMQIQILDNSRQRFIVYKALCSMEHFSELVSELTVIVDAGGSGVQLTLFSDGKLLHTQHVYLGATNIWDNLRKIRQSADSREALLKMLYAEIESFADTFLGEQIPKRLIIINNPIVSIKRARLEKKEGFFS